MIKGIDAAISGNRYDILLLFPLKGLMFYQITAILWNFKVYLTCFLKNVKRKETTNIFNYQQCFFSYYSKVPPRWTGHFTSSDSIGRRTRWVSNDWSQRVQNTPASIVPHSVSSYSEISSQSDTMKGGLGRSTVLYASNTSHFTSKAG